MYVWKLQHVCPSIQANVLPGPSVLYFDLSYDCGEVYRAKILLTQTLYKRFSPLHATSTFGYPSILFITYADDTK